MLDLTQSCPKGSHWKKHKVQTNVLNAVSNGVMGACEKNDSACTDYDTNTGHCKKCKWGHSMSEDSEQGNHCKYAWWFIFMICACAIGGLCICGPSICCILSCFC